MLSSCFIISNGLQLAAPNLQTLIQIGTAIAIPLKYLGENESRFLFRSTQGVQKEEEPNDDTINSIAIVKPSIIPDDTETTTKPDKQ